MPQTLVDGESLEEQRSATRAEVALGGGSALSCEPGIGAGQSRTAAVGDLTGWGAAFALETWTGVAGLRLVAVFGLLFVCSYLGIDLSRQSEGVATIWLTNGILFGIVITRPKREWLGYFLAGLLADTAADMAYGDPLHLAVGVSVANSVEVVVSTLLLTRWFGHPLNLSKRRPLIGFLVASVLGATAVASAIGATWTVQFVGAAPWWGTFRTWYFGDMLGMAILAPLVFMMQRPGFFGMLRARELPRTLTVLAVPAITVAVVFTHSSDPLVFFLFPALLLVVFRLGFPGTVLTIVMVAMVSISLTVTGHGPLMLIGGEHALQHRIVIAQIFLAVALFTTFPVAALLEERGELQRTLAENEERFRRLANSDELTGLSNRRAFNVRLEKQWGDSLRRQEPLGLLLLDADLFKSYNDIYGHVGGDECLRCIASVIAQTLEGGMGTAARFGGEEFAVILPGTAMERAVEIGEEICGAIAGMKLPHRGSATGMQTISVGVASRVPAPGEPVTELIAVADRALYRAKDAGRNCVVAGE